MIGSLRGKILEKRPPTLLIDVNGLGYEVDCPISTCFSLPDPGAEVFIYTHLVVREDAQLLYGFASFNERRLFRELIKINNVGPKLALAILSSLEPSLFVQCVMDHDVSSLVRVPGVGKKTAERLMIEMQDRLASWDETPSGSMTSQILMNREPDAKQDALSALVTLGYKPNQARSALAKCDDEIISSEDMIKFALKNM